MTMLIAIDNGYQACMMAPTEILANQHFDTITRMLKGMDIRVELLTGNVKSKRRENILRDLTCGEVNILIGTHAVIEDTVHFSSLGLVVIDEQHRFGVAQRAKLWAKNVSPPHVLVMTATPIPRTLAMTLYGDLDVSVIDELPPGRKPVQTLHCHLVHGCGVLAALCHVVVGRFFHNGRRRFRELCRRIGHVAHVLRLSAIGFGCAGSCCDLQGSRHCGLLALEGKTIPDPGAHIPDADACCSTDAHLGLHGAHGVAAASANTHGADAFVVHVRQGGQIVYGSADVVHAGCGILEMARGALAFALVGDIKGQGHIALLGQIPAIQRGHLFLHAATGMGEDNGRIGSLGIEIGRKEHKTRNPETCFHEGDTEAFLIMGVYLQMAYKFFVMG